MAYCKYCNKEITWMKEGRRNKAYESDGGEHKCEVLKDSKSSLKSMDRTSLSAEEIKKYEDAMNQQKAPKKKKKSV